MDTKYLYIIKQTAIAVGISILFPLTLWWGINVMTPEPEWEAYDTSGDLHDPRRMAAIQAWDHDYHLFGQQLFYIAVPLGGLAIVGGSYIGITSIASGFIVGGFGCILLGLHYTWDTLAPGAKFILLLFALCCLIMFGYRLNRRITRKRTEP